MWPTRVLLVLLVTLALAGPVAASDSIDDRVRALIKEGDDLGAASVRSSAEALARYREADRLVANSSDSRLRATVRTKLAVGYFNLDRLTDAVEAASHAVQMARDAGAADLTGAALRTLGGSLIGLARFEEAETALKASAEISATHGTSNDLALAWNNLSVNARMQGKLGEAIGFGRQALGVTDRALDNGETLTPRVLFAVPFNVGKALADSGDYLDSRAYLDRAFTTAKATGDIGGQMHVLFDTGEWYEAQGDLGRAARYYERAVEFGRQHEAGLDGRGKSLRGLGRIAIAAGRVADAVRYLAEAVNALDRSQQVAHVVPALVDLARARDAAGDPEGAARDLERAIAIARQQDQATGLVLALIERGRQRLLAGRLDDSASDFSTAVVTAEREQLLPLTPAAWAGRASLAEARADWIGALASSEEAARALERIRGRVVSIDLRTSFAAAAHDTFAGIVRVLMVLHAADPVGGYGERAFAALERERSLALDVALVEARAASTSGTAPAAMRIAQIQNVLFTPDLAADRRQSLLRALDDAERDLAMAEAGSAGRGRERGVAREYPTLASLQAALAPNETVVEYLPAAVGAAAFVVTPTTMRIVPLSLPADLETRVDFFVSALQSNSRDAAIASGRGLAARLLDPVLAQVDPNARLMFVTSGALARLPFAALPVTDARGRVVPLLARHDTTYLPSLTILERQRRQGQGRLGRSMLAVADATSVGGYALGLPTLPASRTEVRAVTRPETGSRVLIGADATEHAVKRELSAAFSVVHLATHAILDPTVPERSAVLLGASDDEDGLLQSREIYELPIAGSLVVLSGCRTADGQASGAEGLRSLARAFLQAGGRTVVGSLWDIDDTGAAAMVMAFYAQIEQGRDGGAALRAAQLALAGHDPYASSRMWAAMVLQGDPAVMMERAEASAVAALPASMLIALIAWLFGCSAWSRRAPSLA